MGSPSRKWWTDPAKTSKRSHFCRLTTISTNVKHFITTSNQTNMRAFILFLIAAMAMVAYNKPQNQFEISGDIQQVSGDWVILAKASDNELLPIDSMQVKDGRFNFKGTIDIPEMYYLHFKADEQYLGFFVEPGKLQISGTPEEPEYSGMPTQEKYDKLMEQMRVYELKFEELTREYREAMAGNDEAAKKEIEKELKPLRRSR